MSSFLMVSSEAKLKEEFLSEKDGLEFSYGYSQDENLTLQLHLKETSGKPALCCLSSNLTLNKTHK